MRDVIGTITKAIIVVLGTRGIIPEIKDIDGYYYWNLSLFTTAQVFFRLRTRAC